MTHLFQEQIARNLLTPNSNIIVAWREGNGKLQSLILDTTQPDVYHRETDTWGRDLALAVVNTQIHGSFVLENAETRTVMGDGSRIRLACRDDGLYLVKEHYNPALEGGMYYGAPEIHLCPWEHVVHTSLFPYDFSMTHRRIFSCLEIEEAALE